MKLEKEIYAILAHFAKFADSVVIRPDEPLYVCSKDRSIVSRAAAAPDVPKTLPIYNISLFVSIMKMFMDSDHTIDVQEDRIIIKSDDGKFSQEFYLGDESILLVPNPEKTDKYFDIDCDTNFKLTADDMKTFLIGTATNSSSTICFEATNGKISLVAADVDNSGNREKTNTFRYATSVSTDKEFFVGFKRECFVFAPGDYEVSINKAFIRFEGQTVSYLIPLLGWSQID